MANHPNRSRGRPPLPPEQRYRKTTISLDPEVAAAFDALGPGKHPKANAILRAALIPS